MTTFAVVHEAHDHSWASFGHNIIHIDMKRLFTTLTLIVALTSFLIANEKVDSLGYYIEQLTASYQSNKIDEICYNYENLLRVYKESLGEVSQDTIFANMEGEYGDICFRLGDYPKAIELFTQASTIYKNALGVTHPYYVFSLSTLSNCYSLLGDYNKTIELETETTEIFKLILGADHPFYAGSLYNLAISYSKLGNYNEAIKLETEALEITERILGTDHPDYAMSLANLAGYYDNLGNYNEAIKLGTEALEIRKRTLDTDHPDYVKSLGNLAGYYDDLGNYNEAIKLGTEALEIRKRTLGTEHLDYAASLANLAIYYNDLGNYNEAIKLGTEALEIFKKTVGTEHLNYAESLNNLALYNSSLGNYNEAIKLGTEALEIKKRTLGTEHLDYTTSLNNLATYYSKLGNYNEAIKLGTEALEIRKRILGTDHPDYAASLANIACEYSSLHNYNEAIKLGTEALEIRKRTLGTDHPDYGASLANIACDYYEHGNYNEACQVLYAYVQNVHKNVLVAFIGMTSHERQLYWDKYRFDLNQLVPCIFVNSEFPNSSSILYDDTALFAKGLLLFTEMEMIKIIQESNNVEAKLMYSELRQNRQILNAQYLKPIAERYINCDSLERVSSDLERQLVSQVKEFGDYTRNLSITWKDVQSQLDDSDIAIEFLSYNKTDSTTAYIALTLCKNDTAPVLTPLFNELQLKIVAGDEDTYQNSAANGLIWGPLMNRLADKSHVYFSASGMLHSIGIEYLPSMDGKDCHRLSSTRELVTHKPSQSISSATTATIFGGINYNATYGSIESSAPKHVKDYYAMNTETSKKRGSFDYRSIQRYGVDSLRGSLAEMQEIYSMLKNHHVQCDTLSGTQASEESFKALSGQRKSLLHISTHGFYYTPEETENLNDHLKRMLIQNDRPTHYEDQSLLRCWLCFAGANQAICDTLPDESRPVEGQEDGILNALEIAQTDLRGLDLVVLSACQTALGDVSQGEGVFGLQRGFKKAGAQSILMSLWNVDDEVTQLLMTEFYRAWTSGMTKTAALKSAQSKVKSKYPDPRHWAAFILLDALD